MICIYSKSGTNKGATTSKKEAYSKLKQVSFKLTAILLSLVCLPALLVAQHISGTGFGETEEIARQNALANLSSQLYVQVESRITDVSGEEDLRTFAKTVKEITTTSNLPLMGTKFLPAEKIRNEYKVSVILEPERALVLSEDKLKTLLQKLSETAPLIKSNKGDNHNNKGKIKKGVKK